MGAFDSDPGVRPSFRQYVAYAAALRDAGVAAEVHVMPGAFHASNLLVPGNDLSERWADAETHALRRGLGLL